MKRIAIASLLVFCLQIIYAQEYKVPKNYSFSYEEDYKTYQPQVVETMQWMLQTPLNTDLKKRKKATEFVLDWLSGEPNVKVMVDYRVADFIGRDPDLLMAFMIGWTQYSLNNNYNNDSVQGNKAGIETAVQFYRKNSEYIKRNSSLEYYAELIEKGNLETDIKRKLK